MLPSFLDTILPLVSLAFLMLCTAAPSRAGERPRPDTCTYEVQVWNITTRSSGAVRKVEHAYDALAAAESDEATGCTVCSEDQVELSLPPFQPFSVCRRLAPRVQAVISGLVSRGAQVRTIRGYQVIRSRGPADGNGDRTEFSNQSFGTAIDIDPEQNGLYENCTTFGPQCRLLRGGPWRPGAPGSLTPDGDVVRSFKAAGFRWGGEIAGQQKDFMHFSLTGY